MVCMTWFDFLWEDKPRIWSVLLDLTVGSGNLDGGGRVFIKGVFGFDSRDLCWLRKLPRLCGSGGGVSSDSGRLESLELGHVEV